MAADGLFNEYLKTLQCGLVDKTYEDFEYIG
ncbi:hypothetical protein EYZ11_012445 [Aspergillus tanneri]|uniref:Uncharacterized protein n=1 Tax=Aspergillus tanneri TaxID=1220188 RepID=A0A4S3J082_9EURO|nr:hypothetical protein EYZ11_012445 [Aspergillus tanneri]